MYKIGNQHFTGKIFPYGLGSTISLTIINNMADNPANSLPTEGKPSSKQSGDLPEMSSAEDIVNKAREEIEKTMEKAMANQQGGQEFEEVIEFFDPIQDPYGKAIKYLEQHDILQLFQVIHCFCAFSCECFYYLGHFSSSACMEVITIN